MKQTVREKRKQEVLRLWEKHYPDITVQEMEGLMRLSYRTIYRYLKEEGCRLPPKRVKTTDMQKVKRAHLLYAKHGQKTKVARIMSMSVRQIQRYLKMDPNKKETTLE